jgi:hypothetical protein
VGVDGAEFVVADIPGLIEGAHEGRGLGDMFLGHVERCAVLLHLVDGTAEDVVADYETIIGELDAYGGGLAEKPRVTVLNKIDALIEDDVAERRAALEAASGGPVMTMSGVARTGLVEVLRVLRARIDAGRSSRPRRAGRAAAMEAVSGYATPRLADARRLVVKIGSSLLVAGGSDGLRTDWLASLAADIARIKARGTDVIVVSSGSIALGRAALSLGAGALSLDEAQAAAAVGQIRLARAWEEALAPHGITTAQILLTLDDSGDRRRYLNTRATLAALLGRGAVPIVNENDTIATDEIRYGDNDRLAAQVATMAGADVCVLCPMWTGFTPPIPGPRRGRNICR